MGEKFGKAHVHSHTVFVRNLPYTLSDSQLQEVFGEVGPVRKSFVVKEKGSQQSRGFGYVQFAIAEDATRAVEAKDGAELYGRKIKVALANHRAPIYQRLSKRKQGTLEGQNEIEDCKTQNQNELQACDHVENNYSEKQRVARTVIFGCLETPEMHEEVIEHAKKAGPVELVQWSMSSEELKGRGLEKHGCRPGAAAVVYGSVKAASNAVASLHQRSIAGGKVWARQLGGEGAKPQKWKVIIRNLPFQVKEDEVKQLLSHTGFVWDLTIPSGANGKCKGFAVASFIRKADAENAIKIANGKTLHKRPVAVDWAVERSLYKAKTGGTTSQLVTGSLSSSLPSDIEDEMTASEGDISDGLDDHQSNEGLPERAPDGFEESISSFNELDMTKNVFNKLVRSISDRNDQSGNDEKSTPTDGKKLLHKMSSHGTSGSLKAQASTDKMVGIRSLETSNQESKAPEGDLNRTIFIQNLPFEVQLEDVKRQFQQYGKVLSAYLVQHPLTKRPKGSAFLEFSTAESAEAAASAAERHDDGELANDIMFGGRRLFVRMAIDRKSAKSLKCDKVEHDKMDRRNLYLIKEGKIDADSVAARGVSDKDMEKRRQLEHEKATKLKSPNFHVSRTRLAVYNIPKSLSETELRDLFINAVKSRATKQHPVVKEVRLLKDEKKGGMSRGVAFVEFLEHQHALVALRVLNNNPGTFSPDKRPIVGFAIENLRTLKKHQERQREASAGILDGKKEQRKPSKLFFKEGNQSQDIKDHDRDPHSTSTKKKRKMDKRIDTGESQFEQKSDQSSTSLVGQKRKRKSLSIPKENVDSADVATNNMMPPSKKQEGQAVPSDFKRNYLDVVCDQGGLKKKTPCSEHTATDEIKPSLKKRKRRILLSSVNGKHPHITDLKENPNQDAMCRRVANLAEPGSSGKKQKRKNSQDEMIDKLDTLVAVYRNKYFSLGSTVTETNKKVKSSDLKRWFE